MQFLRVYFRSLNILWSSERLLTLALIFACAFVGFVQVVEPLLFGRVIDALSGKYSLQTVLVSWGALGAVNIGASVFMAVSSDRLAHRQRLNMLGQAFGRVIALPFSYHSQHGSGRVVRGLALGTEQLFNLWLSFLREHLSSIFGILFLVPLALSMNLRMAGFLLLLSVVYMVANFRIHTRTHARQQLVENFHQGVFARVGDVIGNVTVVQSYTRLMDEMQALQRLTAQVLTQQYPILTWWGILAVITRISSTLTMVAILGFGAYLVRRHEMSVGQVVAFASFSTLLIGRLDQLSTFFSRVISQAPALHSFFQLLDQNDGALEVPHAKTMGAVLGQVDFKGVSYRHKNSPNGVFDLNFSVPAGHTVALVGPSGSGKTTTLALLQRLFDPQEGSIQIDGEDIRNFTLQSLRASIATVFQDSGLFNRSISENIRIGRPSASDAEVEDAARRADAHNFIMTKPGGYEFVIGERGGALSGGERQRLAIARAVIKHAPILVLDEATSALDNQTEKNIQKAIANLRAEKNTTFIIAHRLSTVISADQILVFDQGRIIQSGTFVELQQQQGVFRELLTAGEIAGERLEH